MSRPVAIYVGGVTEPRQAAVREDGAVFTRVQRVIYHPWKGTLLGWSRWARSANIDPGALPDRLELGFATLYRAYANGPCINDRALFDRQGRVRVRLPEED